MEEEFEPPMVVIRLRDGCSFDRADSLLAFVRRRGLEIDRLGEDGEGELGQFGTVRSGDQAELNSLAEALNHLDEVDGAYVKSSACPP